MTTDSILTTFYRKQIIQAEMRKAFLQTTPNRISIQNILSDRIYKKLEQSLLSQQLEKTIIPDRHSFTLLEATQETALVFQSDELLDLIEHITGKRITTISLVLTRYTHRDYTLLYDGKPSQEHMEFFLVITSPSWQGAWGGNKIYRDAEGNSIVFTPTPNTLIIVNKPSYYNSFVRYVNSKANNLSVIFIEGTLE